MIFFLIVVKRLPECLVQRIRQQSVSLNSSLDYYCNWLPSSGPEKILFLSPREADPPQEWIHQMTELLSFSIAQYLVSDLSPLLLEDYLRFRFSDLPRKERGEIAALVRSKHRLCGTGFQERIRQRLREYLLHEDRYLNIEGFVPFRLPDYREELYSLMEEVVEDFLSEKEYREFVRLLKYFLELQEPKIETVHLAIDGRGDFQITDQWFQKVDPKEWEEFDLDYLAGDGDYEDVLASMLVTVAPRQIILHQNVLHRYPRVADTLRRIFDRRLHFCHNCSYCRLDVFHHLITGDKS
ncbi:MAG TPA: putative sporulation protein YtxC [Bacillota bacterium]|nr:hypothetical protein [Bacillota bacterium]HOB87817.1 putative sporulation protein YtxC [Bacillota bacterium]HOP69435.1 putative sporulation protein YtxC [Bacillota bacterium]HPT34359.1 putative sporulation protein YtxC [Bacillota bacterium]HPZ64263.1 putative sporulation protein YtxC [Bacillota bacterium]